MSLNRDLLLEEYIDNYFLKIIEEEKCINDEVRDMAYNMTVEITNEIKNKKEKYIFFSDGVHRLNVTNKCNFKGIGVTIETKYIHFDGPKYYREYSKEHIVSDAKSIFISEKICFIKVTSYGISGKINENDIRDSLQHEFNHIFQSIIGSKSLLNFKSDFLYNIATNNLSNKDELIKKIAWLLYYSYDFEQDGFINGLYGYYNSNESKVPQWDDIREMEIYNAIKCLKDNIKYLKEGKIKENDVRKVKSIADSIKVE